MLASSLGYLRDTHLLAVLAHVRVHLTEGTQHAEVTCMQAGLLSQVRIHILVTDGWQFGDICIVPVREKTGALGPGTLGPRSLVIGQGL